jgi:MerR family transcriptional regulator, mercuric resistance operon regulatory protein
MFGIGALSRDTGCHIETIRYYEKLGLLPEPQRSAGGHRLYNKTHLKHLTFILKARSLGFSLDKTRELLSLSENSHSSCSEALMLVEANLEAVGEKMVELQRIKEALLVMAGDCKDCCPSAKAPECTIVESLSNNKNMDKN